MFLAQSPSQCNKVTRTNPMHVQKFFSYLDVIFLSTDLAKMLAAEKLLTIFFY